MLLTARLADRLDRDLADRDARAAGSAGGAQHQVLPCASGGNRELAAIAELVQPQLADACFEQWRFLMLRQAAHCEFEAAPVACVAREQARGDTIAARGECERLHGEIGGVANAARRRQ